MVAPALFYLDSVYRPLPRFGEKPLNFLTFMI